MATRRLGGMATSSSVPDNGGDHSGGGGSGGSGKYVDDVFSTYLYTGTSAAQEIVNGIDLADKGGMVWVKNRGAAADHALVHSEASNEYLSSNNSNNSVGPIGYPFVDPTATGFTVNIDGGSSLVSFNTNGNDYTSWTFAKQAGFFDVVTYTGDAVNGRAIPHNLGVVPGMVIIKKTSGSGSWYCWHRNYTGGGLTLNSSQVFPGDTAALDPVQSSTDIILGNNVYGTSNASGEEYVAYLFAHDTSDTSVIQCGSYASTNSSPLPVSLGWEPQWVMIKGTDNNVDWSIFDTMRGIVTDGNDRYLLANTAAQEAGGANFLSVNPDGFSIDLVNAMVNGGTLGDNYIYVAIRRPNKPAEEFEPEELFAISGGVDPHDSNAGGFTSGFPVDMAIWALYTSTYIPKDISQRLTQGNTLKTTTTSGQTTDQLAQFDKQDGWYDDGNAQWMSWMWRRAPGFFDVVTYEGNGVAGREVPHSLAAVPEMLWLKRLNDTSNWTVWSKSIGVDRCLYLNRNLSDQDQSAFNDTVPTDTVFTVETDTSCNAAGSDYIAYLFASTPGICDIGTYTGTGSLQSIDCGFTNSARFVLIKRVDASGDWMYWDTLRGIVSGMSPYLTLNTTAAQVDAYRVYPDPAGFQLSDDPSVNTASGEYIYMAIA